MVQAVILAAGKSTRTHPLTLTRPKPLLPILNKPLLTHTLDQLVELPIDEVIIIVGYMKEKIIELYGKEYKGLKLIFFEQKEQLGTMHALHQVKHMLKDRFLVVNGDDLYHYKDMKACFNYRYALLVKEVRCPERFGIVKLENEKIKSIVEKPKEFMGNLASIGLYMLDRKIFDYPMEKGNHPEYFLPITLNYLCREHDVYPVPCQEYWLPIGYPWDLLNCTEFLMAHLSESRIEGRIEDNAQIKGKVQIGKGTVVKSGSYIEGNVIIGENCVIGPNAYLQNGTVIGNNCKIGHHVSVKNSILFDNAKVSHLSYIGDSILGEGVNIGAGSFVANVRHDSQDVSTLVKGEKVSTGRKKFGIVLADNVKVGINTKFYPGVMAWPEKTTMPGDIAKKNID